MSIRRIRYFLILFVAGFAWGYVGKTFISTAFYIGHDDPQVIEERGTYEIKRSHRSQSSEVAVPIEDLYVDPESTPGTVGL